MKFALRFSTLLLIAGTAHSQSLKQRELIANDKIQVAEHAKDANRACGSQINFSVDYSTFSDVSTSPDNPNQQNPWAFFANVTDALKCATRRSPDTMLAVANRLLGSFAVLFAVSIVLFGLIHAIPVSPARVVLGNDASEEDVAAFDAENGLDRPVTAQYLAWAGHALRGDFGRSLVDDTAITRTVQQTLPVTVELVVWSFLLSLVLAIPLGIVSALQEDRWVDHVARGFATLACPFPASGSG